MTEKIAVVGIGYVGLPVAIAFAHKYPGTIGFDANPLRVSELQSGHDRTGELTTGDLADCPLQFTFDPEELRNATFFVVAVPTPIDNSKRPDLGPLRKASELVGRVMQPGSVVVYESTVYPGVTEDICGPILAEVSGLKQGVDFKLGYSPERINPGDKEHTLQKIVKVVSGEDAETLDRVAKAYGSIVDAGVHPAPTIRTAEAAKVIENTQRDLNIALMNELALIFDRMDISTRDVLAAARTKWNFLPFSPGLVGGHCIGVDPYYLTMKAEELGYHPEVILAGRRINNGMGEYIAKRVVQLMLQADISVKGARVGILGLTFKENVPDLRNSRVPDIVNELAKYSIKPLIHDPYASTEEAEEEYGIHLSTRDEISNLDALILAVPHNAYLSEPLDTLLACLRPNGILADVRSALDRSALPTGLTYWSL
jgi:UDP-N-acetyl-D-galactosamine dehydrogenase